MESNKVIIVKNVTKNFRIYKDKNQSLKKKFIKFGKKEKKQYRKALDNISFEVEKGESLAIIGKNGGGKSTILKILTKILKADSGCIETQGKVCALIELGAGFHPDMTGRENIYINASIFGLKKKEVDKKMQEIIEFAELENFIDEPIRTYSSGMYMRLAFSIAINVNADVIIIDEILSVGDASFQKKCFEKLSELKNNGVTMIIVSHSVNQIRKLCDRAIWIDGGKIIEEGECERVISNYMEEINV